MSDEDRAKLESMAAKMEARLAYNREWQKNRYHNDPEWRAKMLEASKRYHQKRREESIANSTEPRRGPGRPRKKSPPVQDSPDEST